MLSIFPQDVLDEIWDLIQLVSVGGGGGEGGGGSYLLLHLQVKFFPDF